MSDTQSGTDTATAKDSAIMTGLDLLFKKLAAPFPESEIKWKPQAVKGNRALALAYIDARMVMDRLDAVIGPADWEDSYDLLEGNSVRCRLRVRVGERWIERQDVGSPSEQPDEGDRMKAAFSDALKRVAVKFGIGRYLYRLPQQWADYDPVKKQFTSRPRLPEGHRGGAPTHEAPAASGGTRELPKSGKEMADRLVGIETQLIKAGRCKKGELLDFVRAAGVKAGYKPDFGTWQGPAIELAAKLVSDFQAAHKAPVAAANGKANGNGPTSQTERKGAPFVTADQAAELGNLIRDSFADYNGFLEYYQIPEIAKLPAAHYSAAKGHLLDRIERYSGASY